MCQGCIGLQVNRTSDHSANPGMFFPTYHDVPRSVVTGDGSVMWGLMSLWFSRSSFHGHRVAVDAVGVVSALKAGRVEGDRTMPAVPVYLDLENNIFFSRSFPISAHLARAGSHGRA